MVLPKIEIMMNIIDPLSVYIIPAIFIALLYYIGFIPSGQNWMLKKTLRVIAKKISNLHDNITTYKIYCSYFLVPLQSVTKFNKKAEYDTLGEAKIGK